MNTTTTLFLALTICALGCMAACAPEPSASVALDEVAQAPTVFRDRTAHGRYVIEVRPRPNPIPLNEPFELGVRVFDGKDETTPVSGVVVTVDGQMPGHGHGMLRASRVEEEDGGLYVCRGMLFHMGGYWELVVDVASKEEDGTHFTVSSEGVVFPVEL